MTSCMDLVDCLSRFSFSEPQQGLSSISDMCLPPFRMVFKLPRQCCGIARTGKRCNINETSKTKTSEGVLASDTLLKGCRQCLYHLDLFVTVRTRPGAPVVVCWIDFETTGYRRKKGSRSERTDWTDGTAGQITDADALSTLFTLSQQA